nr:hypothetical protein [Tanacetum cinerariifolium]
MATSNNPYTFPVLQQDQPSFNQNYMQQPMSNPEDIINPITAMNMALALMAKAFKLNYSTPTNNNQRILSNPRNRQIAQPRNLNGYNDVQNVENQVIQNAVQNPRIQNVGNQNGLIVVPGNANQNPNGNGNLVAARAEGNEIGHNADLDEIEEVNANFILMASLQQASTSGTQTDKAPVYDSDGSAEYTELLKPIPEPHQVPHNDNNVIYKVFSVEQSGGTAKQHPVNVEETPSSKNRPPMLNKENYVPWSSRLLRHAKSIPNGKIIRNFIINGPYVRRMIPEPGDPNREVPVNETFHVQADDELTEKELKKIEADDQAIQTILLGLFEDIYAAVDSNGGNQFRQYAGQNVENLNGYNDVQNVGNQVIQNAVQNPRIQ